MARKTLLTEGEIRQFMKLAKLPAVGDARLTEFVGPTETGEEDSLEEVEIAEEEEIALEGEEELDAEVEDAPELDGGEEDVEMDLDMGDTDAEMGDSADVDAEELVTRIAHDLESLARMAGVDVDVEDDAPDDGGDMELDAELGPAEDPGAEVELGDEDEDLGAMMEEEEIVNEVARRVAARLQAQEDRDEMVSTLAERILNRITNAK